MRSSSPPRHTLPPISLLISIPCWPTELAAIPHASTAIVTLAYRREEISHPLDGHGYVIPRAEGSPILACTWSSRKWAGRAPEGWELIRVFIGRAGQEEVLAADDETLVALAVQEVAARLGVTAPASLTRVRRWPRGMPQYLLGHPERVARIEATALQARGTLPRRQCVPRGRSPRLHRVGRARRGCGGGASSRSRSHVGTDRRVVAPMHPRPAAIGGATNPTRTA